MVVNVASLVLIGFLAFPANAEDFLGGDATPAVLRPRVRVAAHNIEETDIRDCLSNAVEAANSENLDGFVNCFTGSTKPKIRKQAAIHFVQHDVAMELLDTQVIKAGKTTGEVAVKYRLVLSEDRFDVVSLVAMKQENGYWTNTSRPACVPPRVMPASEPLAAWPPAGSTLPPNPGSHINAAR